MPPSLGAISKRRRELFAQLRMRTLAPTLARSALRGVAMKTPGVSISSTFDAGNIEVVDLKDDCLLYTSPSPRDRG